MGCTDRECETMVKKLRLRTGRDLKGGSDGKKYRGITVRASDMMKIKKKVDVDMMKNVIILKVKNGFD